MFASSQVLENMVPFHNFGLFEDLKKFRRRLVRLDGVLKVSSDLDGTVLMDSCTKMGRSFADDFGYRTLWYDCISTSGHCVQVLGSLFGTTV